MATLWIQTAALMVLLVMSCPSSQAIAAQRLCGSHLVDALSFVCGDRGFYFSPATNYNTKRGNAASAVTGNKDPSSGDQIGVVPSQNILDACCYKPCNLYDLQNYCH
ncbi:insulin [Nematolebias whitei]|uniref:insulin n=1 Tax=Nematolebias whitei TaxID=451745 RepID=UPI00189883AC|nr:insulin [Nematolebias whitei]